MGRLAPSFHIPGIINALGCWMIPAWAVINMLWSHSTATPPPRGQCFYALGSAVTDQADKEVAYTGAQIIVQDN